LVDLVLGGHDEEDARVGHAEGVDARRLAGGGARLGVLVRVGRERVGGLLEAALLTAALASSHSKSP
jgi:hypothetical protein